MGGAGAMPRTSVVWVVAHGWNVDNVALVFRCLDTVWCPVLVGGCRLACCWVLRDRAGVVLVGFLVGLVFSIPATSP